MKLTDISIRRPVTTAMIAIGLCIFGIIGISRMPIDLFPNVTLPVIVVGTFYPGAGPLEVEAEVTDPLEKQLSTCPNLKEITSNSMENVSTITLQFEWGTDIDAASSDIRDRLDMAQGLLPDAAQKPFVFKFDPSLMPVMLMSLSGEIDEMVLADITEDIEKQLQRVSGVASVGIGGVRKRQVQIEIDLRLLAQSGVTVEAFAASLKAQNLNFPVGTISTKDYRYLIRLIGQYENLEEIGNTVIGQKGGVPIRIRDVAKVSWVLEERKAYARLNSKNSIFIWVQRRTDANTVAVARAIRAEVERIRETLPPGVVFNIFWDSSEMITRSVQNVITNLILGGILASLILFLFLRRFRATIFVVFAIPISIFFALFFIYLFGFTINILSIAGLAIAVGMVVDNSIVVFESIFRLREEGKDHITAASEGTTIVGMAITASTLTTIAVFLPMLLLRGMIQIFFKELALSIVFALLASLGIALTLIPMLASRFLKLAGPTVAEKGFRNKSERLYNRFLSLYGNILDWSINHRRLIIILTTLLFIISLGIIPFLGMEFIPEQRMRHIELFAEMPVGSGLATTNEAIEALERYILDKWSEEIEGLSVQIGGALSTIAAAFGGAKTNSAEIDIVMKKGTRYSAQEVAEEIRQKAREIPGLIIRAGRTGFGGLIGGGAAIQIDIIGHDLATADSLAKLILNTIETIPGLVDLKVSREPGEPEIQLVVDRQKAALYGLSPYQIGSALRAQIEGNIPTRYRMKGKEYDILLRLREDQRDEISNLLSLTINNPQGAVLLKDLVTQRPGVSPLAIEHKNISRIVSITANVVGQSSGRMAQRVSRRISHITPPPDFTIKLSGAYEEMVKSFRDIAFAVAIAIILVFMVMASQFESLRDPFIIIFTIPLAIIGVIWLLFITGTTISVISGVGVLVLVGVVVNNGIVYIDYVNQLRKNYGMGLEEAVKKGGQIRMRPILMTALTTIFGLLPLALKIGEGAEFWSPLGRAVIGGMITSTFLTLIFIPVLYTSFEKGAEKRRLRKY